MSDEINRKDGRAFWDFVRNTAEEVADWPECKRAAQRGKEAEVSPPVREVESVRS